MRTSRALAALLLFPLCSLADHFEVPVFGGVTFSELSNNDEVQVGSSPQVTNVYLVDEHNHTGGLVGAGIAYSWDHVSEAPFTYHLGLMGYFVNFGEVEGLELPFANAGQFDTLDYRFRVKSTAYLLQTKMLYTADAFQPYAFLGLGVAKNRAYDFKEKATDPDSSAVANPHPFQSKTITSFAYEIGLGVQHRIANYPHNRLQYYVSLDYRYLNYGDAKLGFREGQTTRESLEVDSLHTQTIVLAITTLF